MTSELALPFSDFLERLPLGVFIVDGNGRVIECNTLFLTMADAPRERVIGFNLLESSRDPALIPYLRRALAGEPVDFDTPYTSTTGGKSSHYHYHFRPLPEGTNDGARLLCFAQDVSRIKIVENTLAALRLSEEKFSKAFLGGLDPMIISEIATGRIHEVNESFTQTFGFGREEVLGRTTLEIDLWVDPLQRERTATLMREQGVLRNREVDMRTKDGRILTVLGSATQLTIDGSTFWLAQFRDITGRKRLMAEMERAANFDHLTGVASRRYFMLQAEQELLRAKRYGRPLSLLMLDLDHFKWINDRHGHLAGDKVLQQAVSGFSGALRVHDVLGRVGGEEFAALLPETKLPQAIEVAQRICELTAEMSVSVPSGATVRVTVSIGVATTRPDSESIDGLLGRADAALYRAKEAGRNGWSADTAESG